MKGFRIILAIIVIALSSFGLLTDTTGIIMPYVLLLIGLMVIVTGITEFRNHKATSFALFLAAGFSVFVAIYTL